MPNGLRNWSYKQVVTFLDSFHFTETHIRGSHHFYVGVYENIPRVVTIPKHKIIKTGTMKGIIAQSGIPEKIWRKK